MMKFFLTHYCNDYCKQLDLIHPRKKFVINSSFNFFVESYNFPLKPYDEIYKLCDLCRSPFLNGAEKLYYKKIACQETYCKDCDNKRVNSNKQGICIDCNSSFRSSEYWFMMKRTDFPVRCSKCRLENRNRMRKEKNNI